MSTQKSTIQISLTDFMDFVHKTGRSKQVKVRQIKSRKQYHPNLDYWKQLRDGLIDFHEQGVLDKCALDQILKELKDQKKLDSYTSVISSYKRFIGRKKYSWFIPHKGVFRQNELAIRVNPELGLEHEGKKYIVKLYFKGESLTKAEAEIALSLMHLVLSKQTTEEFTYCILDVHTGRLHMCDFSTDLLPLLEGEALSFKTIWLNLP